MFGRMFGGKDHSVSNTQGSELMYRQAHRLESHPILIHPFRQYRNRMPAKRMNGKKLARKTPTFSETSNRPRSVKMVMIKQPREAISHCQPFGTSTVYLMRIDWPIVRPINRYRLPRLRDVLCTRVSLPVMPLTTTRSLL